jgi:hypothetical protein
MTERDWLGTLFAEIARIERDLCPKVCALAAEGEPVRVQGPEGFTMFRLCFMRSEASVLAKRLGVAYKYWTPLAEQGLAGNSAGPCESPGP